MSTIQGIREIRAFTPAIPGATIVVVFEFDKDLTAAAQELRDSTATVRDKLPGRDEDPFINRADPNAQPVMSLALSSDELSPLELSRLADIDIGRQLRSIPGVALVSLEGELEREMTIFLNSNAMREAKISAVDVTNALRSQNLAAPVGRVMSGLQEQSIRLQGRLKDISEFQQMVVKQNGDQAIRLGQIAEIVDGGAEQRRLSFFNGKKALWIDITKAREASTISVTDDIKAVLATITPTLPKGVELVVVRDQGEDVAASMRNVTEALGLGALLTIVVVFVFLNSWRSTLNHLTGVTHFSAGVFYCRLGLWFYAEFYVAIGLVAGDWRVD